MAPCTNYWPGALSRLVSLLSLLVVLSLDSVVFFVPALSVMIQRDLWALSFSTHIWGVPKILVWFSRCSHPPDMTASARCRALSLLGTSWLQTRLIHDFFSNNLCLRARWHVRTIVHCSSSIKTHFIFRPSLYLGVLFYGALSLCSLPSILFSIEWLFSGCDCSSWSSHLPATQSGPMPVFLSILMAWRDLISNILDQIRARSSSSS